MDDEQFNDLMFINDWLSEYWQHPKEENKGSSNVTTNLIFTIAEFLSPTIIKSNFFST